MYYNIVVARPFDRVFTYEADDSTLKIGQIVIVPFGKTMEVGMIIEGDVIKPEYTIKKINTVLEGVQLSDINIKFLKWVSEYTLAPIGSVLKLFIINKDIVSYERTDESLHEPIFKSVKLNEEQYQAKEKIIQIQETSHKPIVLEGVTGSGKTEVYFELIELEIKRSKQVLIMVPEISLTPQLENRFKERFGIEIDVWHSKITPKKRKQIWHKCFEGEPCVIIGARSSLFLPFKHLGLTVIDEEHDSSYKQEDGPRYHARDMAIYKAKCSQSICALVSASPSLESLYNSENQKITSHHLTQQFHQTALPEISIIDMNIHRPSSKSWISKEIYDETMSVLKSKGQVLFFLNRRGYAPTKICVSCHTAIQCQHCAVNLVYHKKIDRLICHHCSSFYDPQQICKMCSSDKFVSLGIGLERLQEEVMRLFPGYQSQVFSSDTLSSKKNKKLMMEKIFEQETNLLIGSQIIGKSFHFPNLKLVNIIDGDSSLFSPDFRAMEKTYQLLQQVAGRSGREGERGKVLIQTFSPQHPIFLSIKDQNRENFIKNELARRKQSHLPPYAKIAQLQLVHPNYPELRSICLEVLEASKKLQLGVLGPTPSLIPYKKNHYQENFYFKETSYPQLSSKISKLLSQLSPKNKRFLHIDIDPLSIA